MKRITLVAGLIPSGRTDGLRRLASIAVPFIAVLPLEYRAPIETVLVVLFPNGS